MTKLTKTLFFVACMVVMCVTQVVAQGWPANYGGVMLQGFYWDSYTASQWSRLEKNADELSRYFSLVWVPQSGRCGDGTSMGYDPKYYWNQNSSFGTEAELRSMISALKAKGTGVIADVVINHRGNLTNWVDFPAETYKGVTYQMKSTDICKDDDNGACKTWADANGYSLSSYVDSGEGWDGMRDLDHNSANVQTVVKAYLDYLKNDLGYTGFRYDMVKGYASKFTGLYNSAVGAEYSVGEYWDGNAANVNNWMVGTKVNDQIQSGAFDFAFRYSCRDAVNGGATTKLPGTTTIPNWSKLLSTTSASNTVYQRYAITFVENHDTEYRSSTSSQDPIIRDTLALNAWMLASPGTPCVFYKHWIDCKKDIKLMIEARKLVGITNQSQAAATAAKSTVVARRVKGTNGYLMVVVGTVSSYTVPTGYTKLLEGKNFAYYVSSDCDKSSWDATVKRVEEESVEEPFTPYDITVYVNTKMPSAFTAGTLNFWTWDEKKNLTKKGAWPGDAVTQTVEKGGETWFYQTYTITGRDYCVNCVFSSGTGTPQTVDVSNITEDKYFVISESMSGTKYEVKQVDEPEDEPGVEPAKLVGGDISVLPLYEEHNSGYLNPEGEKIDDLVTWLVKECGWNSFRVRLFVDPKKVTGSGDKDLCVCQDLDYVKKLGKRIKDAGAKFLLDFHYSDTWADPAYQLIPASWTNTDDDALAQTLKEYTAACMKTLKAYGAQPDYVQIGNEITYGMLKRSTSDAVYPSQTKAQNATAWARLSKLLNAASEAVRANSKAKIIIHTERSGIATQTVNFYNYINDVDYDIVGLSYYPFFHGNISSLSTTLTQLANVLPEKKVQIVETSYPFQYYPSDAKYDYKSTWAASADGQYKFAQDLITELGKHENVNGLYWWQPEEAGNGDDSDWTSGGSGATVMGGWMTRGMWWCDQKTTGHWPVVSSNGFIGNLLGTYAPNEDVVVKGDANGDGVVSVADLSLMASYVLGQAIEINKKNADANGDGDVTVSDISMVASFILK